MGLDFIVQGCAKPGHEVEWRGLIERVFANEQLGGDAEARLLAISNPAHVSAPRAGPGAWTMAGRKATTADVVTLAEFHRHNVSRSGSADGVPDYRGGGLGGDADDTSFHGKVLEACGDVLSDALIADAATHKFPADAIRFGAALLAAADAAEANDRRVPAAPALPARRALLSIFRRSDRVANPLPLAAQIDAVRSAGRWFLVWGERGHPIAAWS